MKENNCIKCETGTADDWLLRVLQLAVVHRRALDGMDSDGVCADWGDNVVLRGQRACVWLYLWVMICK